MLFFWPFGQGRVFFFAVWAGARARPNSKKQRPAQTAKKNTRPAPSERIVVFAVWAGRRAIFVCCLGGGRVFFFAGLGRGHVIFFAVWAGGMFFWLFGRGACFFLLFGRGTGVHSLTGLPGLSSSDPTTKKTKQQKRTQVPP